MPPFDSVQQVSLVMMANDWASALLPFYCARTVSEPHLFDPWNLRFERKQIPRFVGIVISSRKAMESLEATSLPWA